MRRQVEVPDLSAAGMRSTLADILVNRALTLDRNGDQDMATACLEIAMKVQLGIAGKDEHETDPED